MAIFDMCTYYNLLPIHFSSVDLHLYLHPNGQRLLSRALSLSFSHRLSPLSSSSVCAFGSPEPLICIQCVLTFSYGVRNKFTNNLIPNIYGIANQFVLHNSSSSTHTHTHTALANSLCACVYFVSVLFAVCVPPGDTLFHLCKRRLWARN